MSDFFFPTRFDSTRADDGVWMPPIEDELGNSYGTFKVCLFDETTPRHAAVSKRLQNKYPPTKSGKANARLEAMSQLEFSIEALVEVSIVDWDMKNGAGEPVPFTKEACIRYLNDPRALPVFIEISEFARNVLNFQPEDQNGELPEGN